MNLYLFWFNVHCIFESQNLSNMDLKIIKEISNEPSNQQDEILQNHSKTDEMQKANMAIKIVRVIDLSTVDIATISIQIIL